MLLGCKLAYKLGCTLAYKLGLHKTQAYTKLVR